MAFFDAGGVRLYLAIPEDERFRSRPVIYYGVAVFEDAYETAVGRGAVGIVGPQQVHTDERCWDRIVDGLRRGSRGDAYRADAGTLPLTGRS